MMSSLGRWRGGGSPKADDKVFNNVQWLFECDSDKGERGILRTSFKDCPEIDRLYLRSIYLESHVVVLPVLVCVSVPLGRLKERLRGMSTSAPPQRRGLTCQVEEN